VYRHLKIGYLRTTRRDMTRSIPMWRRSIAAQPSQRSCDGANTSAGISTSSSASVPAPRGGLLASEADIYIYIYIYVYVYILHR